MAEHHAHPVHPAHATNPMSDGLIAQLVNPEDAALSAGSNKQVWWRCDEDPRHIWQASPNTRKRSPGCPVCVNKVVIAGVNDLATTHPEMAVQAADPRDARRLHAGSHKKIEWVCTEHPEHPNWTASVVSRIRLGSGCPYCSGHLPTPGVNDMATTHPEIAATLVDPSLATTIGAGSARKILWRCPNHADHPAWLASPRNRIGKNAGCKTCSGQHQRAAKRNATIGDARPDLLAHAVNPDEIKNLSLGSGKTALWHCDKCAKPHTYPMVVKNRVRGQNCPVSTGVKVVPGVNDLATTHPDLASQLAEPSRATMVSRGSTSKETWICENGHKWRTPVYARVAGNGCPTCSNQGTSKQEAEMTAVLQALLPDETVLANVKGILPNDLELDAVVPRRDFAVEFNGTYFHSEVFGRDKNYHANKTHLAKQTGLSLIHVWEDDWLLRRPQVIRGLAHKLGADATSRLLDVLPGADPRIAQTRMARNLQVRIVDGSAARTFLNANHIQGAVTATLHFALTEPGDDSDIRALLSLRSHKNSARSKRSPGTWEIQRYATCGIVAGGFTRLLTHAEKWIRASGSPLNKWVTFAAADVSDGGLYRTAGFTAEAQLPPDYRYVGKRNRWRREPKEAYQRKRFRDDPDLAWDESWTEHQAALENGLYRIYDAGKTRWVKQL